MQLIKNNKKFLIFLLIPVLAFLAIFSSNNINAYALESKDFREDIQLLYDNSESFNITFSSAQINEYSFVAQFSNEFLSTFQNDILSGEQLGIELDLGNGNQLSFSANTENVVILDFYETAFAVEFFLPVGTLFEYYIIPDQFLGYNSGILQTPFGDYGFLNSLQDPFFLHNFDFEIRVYNYSNNSFYIEIPKNGIEDYNILSCIASEIFTNSFDSSFITDFELRMGFFNVNGTNNGTFVSLNIDEALAYTGFNGSLIDLQGGGFRFLPPFNESLEPFAYDVLNELYNDETAFCLSAYMVNAGEIVQDTLSSFFEFVGLLETEQEPLNESVLTDEEATDITTLTVLNIGFIVPIIFAVIGAVAGIFYLATGENPLLTFLDFIKTEILEPIFNTLRELLGEQTASYIAEFLPYILLGLLLLFVYNKFIK